MNIAVVGLGLIGGSFAKSIKKNTNHKVFGTDKNALVVADAKNSGSIDDDISDFSRADIVFIALYPHSALNFLKTQAKSFKKSAVIIDLCGIKRLICEEAKKLFGAGGPVFIGGHPMAGREVSGFSNSSEELFLGASMILTPFNEEDVPGFVLDLFYGIGFRHVELTSPEHHDEVIAYTSQLAHIISSAYIQNPIAEEFMAFSAGSFRDLTRVSRLNDEMWAELFILNSDYLVSQIDTVIENLSGLRNSIKNGDNEALRAILKRGTQMKENFTLRENKVERDKHRDNKPL